MEDKLVFDEINERDMREAPDVVTALDETIPSPARIQMTETVELPEIQTMTSYIRRHYEEEVLAAPSHKIRCGELGVQCGGKLLRETSHTASGHDGMEVVLADGSVIDLGGKCVKTSSGYSLLDLMIGSEGTLGFLTKLTVKLVPQPKVNLSLLLPFNDLDVCIGAVPAVLSCGCEPTAVEFMEREVIACAETYLGKQFPDTTANAYLLVRLDGASVEALKPSMDLLTDLALNIGAKDVLLADTEERKEGLWDARGAFLEAIKNSTPVMDECDVVIPRNMIPAFVHKSVEIAKETGVRICSFGHAGDGNLHIYACKDNIDDAAWDVAVAKVMEELYIMAHKLGGEVSGEHGIGHAKKIFLAESIGKTQIHLMRRIKSVFDPKGILNPGKVVE